MDAFERDLADRLRGWTEPASRRRDFAADARELLAAEPGRSEPRFSLRVALAATTVVAAVALVGLFVSITPPRTPAASSSPSPSLPSQTAAPSPEPSAMAGRDLDLADITWYTLVSVGFGTLTEPGPDDPPLPQGYDELTVGTLDGHVTTQLRLTTRVTEDGHEGAWANGPYGPSVLVGDDDGTRSRVFTVSSVDAGESTLLETDDAVVVAALAEDEGAMYFVPLDRETGMDRGLWRLPLDGGAAEVISSEPIADEPSDYATQWTMDWSTDGSALVTQVCRMRTCRTLVLDAGTGETRLEDGGSPIVGVTDTDYVTESSVISLAGGRSKPLGIELGGQATLAGRSGDWRIASEPGLADARAYALVEAPLGGGELRTLVEVGPEEPTDARMKVGPDTGVDLPAEWVLRWPTEGGRYMDIAVPPDVWYAGELVNVISGERLAIPPTIWPDTPTDCDPVPPLALPSGAVPGDATVTAGGHHLWATWAPGTPDQIVQVVGGRVWGITPPGDQPEPGAPVTIRGQAGRVIAMGSIDGPWAITWQENGCDYEVQMLPGTTEADAIQYAAVYGRDASARPPLVVPAAIAERDPLPWCGHEIVNRQPEGDYRDSAVRDCFLAAYRAGEPAEMVSDIRTVEGGWVREIYRSGSDGAIEVYVDPSRDNMSGDGWTRSLCSTLRDVEPDPAGTAVFFPDDCADGVPISVGDLRREEQRMVEDLVAFAQAPDPERLSLLPFADDVALGLADQVIAHRPSHELLDAETWSLGADLPFRGRVGPYSALDTLAEWNVNAAGILIREMRVTVGPHEHCASPPVPAPAELTGLRRVSVQPVGDIPCLMWWTVDLFLTDEGRIAAVTLDFGEP
jgi:hypothetical protein